MIKQLLTAVLLLPFAAQAQERLTLGGSLYGGLDVNENRSWYNLAPSAAGRIHFDAVYMASPGAGVFTGLGFQWVSFGVFDHDVKQGTQYLRYVEIPFGVRLAFGNSVRRRPLRYRPAKHGRPARDPSGKAAFYLEAGVVAGLLNNAAWEPEDDVPHVPGFRSTRAINNSGDFAKLNMKPTIGWGSTINAGSGVDVLLGGQLSFATENQNRTATVQGFSEHISLVGLALRIGFQVQVGK